MQQAMGGLHRDSFSAYNDQFTPTAMSRALGQADADFPPYDLLYGLVDLFFKHIYPWVRPITETDAICIDFDSAQYCIARPH